jgi:hypothetical protein
MKSDDIIYGLSEISLYLSNIGREDFAQTIEDACKKLELLKEQEARVLDWDEIKNYPVVYGEFKGVKNIFPLIITVDDGCCLSWNPDMNTSKEFILLVDDEEDRKNTRCWNRMPTDEQRKAVKWDD